MRPTPLLAALAAGGGAMASTAPQLPLDLGRPVHHCSNPTKAVGTVIGWVFAPPLGALVRWQDGAVASEAPENLEGLVDPIGTPAALPESLADLTCVACSRSSPL